MNYQVGKTYNIVGLTPISQAILNPFPEPYYKWKVIIYNKKTYYIGAENCPIVDGSFSIANSGGMGTGSLTFSYFDVPLWHRDKVKIYYKGSPKWSGYIDGIPDKKSGKVKLSPYSLNFEKTLFYHDYTASPDTIQNIIQDIITEKSTQLDVLYNATMLNIANTSLKSLKYNYENIKKILDDILKQLSSREDGVDENDFYYIKKPSTSLNKIFYNDDSAYFKTLSYEIKDSKVKQTRFQVFQKSTSNNNVRLGAVGYSTSLSGFESLEIEQLVGIKEAQYNAPQGLNSTNALDFAYNKLVNEAVLPENIKVTDFNIDLYDVKLFEKYRFWTPEYQQWHSITTAESTNGWNGTLSLSTNAYINTYSIETNSTTIYYTSTDSNYLVYKGGSKLGFYFKCPTVGNNIKVAITYTPYITQYTSLSGAWSKDRYSLYGWGIGEVNITPNSSFTTLTKNIYTNSPNIWQFQSIDLDNAIISEIRFYSDSTQLNIDELQVLSYTRKYYDANCMKIDYDISSDFVNLELGVMEENLNSELFEVQKNVQDVQNVVSDL